MNLNSQDSINKFEETGSNLLPPVSRDNRAMIRDILHRLLDIINSKVDINCNSNSTMNLSAFKTEDLSSPVEKTESFMRSFTQPEIHRVRDGRKDIATSPQVINVN